MRDPGTRRVLYEHHAEMCKVFSHSSRLMILDVLRDSELTVAAVASRLGVAIGTVSPHLLMMRRRGVLVSRRQGTQVFYRLANTKMLRAFDLIREILRAQMLQQGKLARGLRGPRRMRG